MEITLGDLSREDLETRALALGIPFRSNLSDENLIRRIRSAEEIADKEASTPEPDGEPDGGAGPQPPEDAEQYGETSIEPSEMPLSERTMAEMALGRQLLIERGALSED